MVKLSQVSKALSRVVSDLQKKAREGYDNINCNGEIVDDDGNYVGEWTFEVRSKNEK